MKAKRMKELLQEQAVFEEQLTQEDRKTYEALFERLNEEPDIYIPMNFADNVAGKITAKATLWADVKLYAFCSGLFLFLIGISIAFFSFDTSTSGRQTQNFFIGNLPFIIFGTLTYFIIQTLDRVLVKGK
jgi:hypothetical protein